MTSPATELLPRSGSQAEKLPDVTGRERLVSNVLFSWAAQSVFIVSGFVLPRMIDHRLGQETLGIWDFSWSLVNYFQLVRESIGSSVSRYTAKYRTTGDLSALNRIASSATCVLGGGGLLITGLTVIASMLLPQLFSHRLGQHVNEAQWVVFFLGLAIAVQVSSSVFNGILTGCHRWDLHNINTSGWYAATVVGMIVALLAGKGLIAQAVITLAGEIMAAIRRVILARRVCKGLRLRPSLVERGTIVELFSFGGKTLLPSVSDLLLNQTTSVLLTAYIGPAALALYSRPRALAHCMKTLVNKMAMTLTPTTSALQSKDDVKGIGELAVKSARYALYLCLPMVLLVTVFGQSIMRIWMGPRYENGWLPAIFVVFNLPVMVQLPTLCILAGVNQHGRAGAARFVASVCSVVSICVVVCMLDGGVIGAALAATLPLAILNVIDIPRLICRRVGMSVQVYFVQVCWRPVLHILPFLACLIVARLVCLDRPLMGLTLGATVGSAILAVVYWRHVLPDGIRLRISKTLQSSGRRTCGPQCGR